MNLKTKYIKRNATELQPSEIEYLLSGQGMSTFRFFAANDNELSAIWRRVAPKILPVWIKHRPGSRPFGWWKFSAPEKCRRLADGSVRELPAWMRYAFGKPTAYQFEDGVQKDYNYESESDFLYRNELLTEHELTLDAEQLRKNTIDEPDEKIIQAVLGELVK